MSECVSVSKYRQLGLRSLRGKLSLLLTLLLIGERLQRAGAQLYHQRTINDPSVGIARDNECH